MRRLVALSLLVLAACSQATNTSTGSIAPAALGASDPRGAVDAFLAGVKAQDIQAVSQVWGTTKGPAREQIPREELEKRILIMQCYFSHDSYKHVNDGRSEGGHLFRVALTKGRLTRETTFSTVRGPSNRWFVESADMDPVKDLCRNPMG